MRATLFALIAVGGLLSNAYASQAAISPKNGGEIPKVVYLHLMRHA